ncbi:MAG: hypothetical protein EP335_18065 [Alphaproteobacteria bacterium]|nr:MAG: hypothetical protein EP335_18065 [Alphaproteobacteria bacterium]
MLLVVLLADAEGARPLAATLILLYISSYVAFFWVRRFLRGPKGMAPSEDSFVGVDGRVIDVGHALRRLLSFQWRLCLVAIIAYLAGKLVETLAGLAMSGADGLSLFYYAVLAVLVASPLIARVWLIMPASAVGHPHAGLFDSWQMTRGATLPFVRLLALMLGLSAGGMLLVDGLAMALAAAGQAGGGTVSALAYILAHLVEVAFSYLMVALWGCVSAIAFFHSCPNIKDFAVIRTSAPGPRVMEVRPAPGH